MWFECKPWHLRRVCTVGRRLALVQGRCFDAFAPFPASGKHHSSHLNALIYVVRIGRAVRSLACLPPNKLIGACCILLQPSTIAVKAAMLLLLDRPGAILAVIMLLSLSGVKDEVCF